MALKDVHDLDLAPVNTLPHGEKIADVFKVGGYPLSPTESPVFLKAENFLHLESGRCGREVQEIQIPKGERNMTPHCWIGPHGSLRRNVSSL